MAEHGTPEDARRTAVQTIGLLLTLIGGLLFTVGVIDLMSFSGYGDGAGIAWVALVGIPVGALGVALFRRTSAS